MGFSGLSFHSATWKSHTFSQSCTTWRATGNYHSTSKDATYYIGHETIVASDDGVIGRVPEAIFSYLSRNAVHEERRYGMPAEQIVEIGTQIDL